MSRSQRARRKRGRISFKLAAEVRQAIQADARQDIRADALARYARTRNGKPVVCTPPGEINIKPKVIFDTVQDAEAFAAIVAAIDGATQTAYPCRYSHTGHIHLTTGDPWSLEEFER